MNAHIEKRLFTGELKFSYPGVVLERTPTSITIEGHMSFEIQKPYVHFRIGDRTVETYYSDRWYNIGELHDVDNDRLKGWYCDIILPVAFVDTEDGVQITYYDIALDVFVSPHGELLVLDEDELEALKLDTDIVAQAWAAVESLKQRVARREKPFDKIKPHPVIPSS